jgi:hypothetical protein
MENRTVISNARACFVEVMHHDSDPGSWIVNRWVKSLLFKKRISSNWFIDKQQAFAFANELRQAHEELLGSARRDEIS